MKKWCVMLAWMGLFDGAFRVNAITTKWRNYNGSAIKYRNHRWEPGSRKRLLPLVGVHLEVCNTHKKVIREYGAGMQKDLSTAVKLLQATGAGINMEEKIRIKADTKISSKGITFENAIDRNMGLLSVTEKGIEETRYWEEGRVSVHLDTEAVCFEVLYWIDENEYQSEHEYYTPLSALPESDFDFAEIPFSDIDRLITLIQTFENGFISTSGGVYMWIE